MDVQHCVILDLSYMTYDLIIIGGGPAGVAAGVYAARKKLKTLFLTKDFGGQSIVSEDIQNWIGTVSINGAEFASNLKKHLLAYAGDSLVAKEGVYVKSIEKHGKKFVVKTSSGDFNTKTVLVTTGSSRKKLEAKGADTFEHKGLTYCASCDGPLFSDKDVLVVGGGNAAFETVAQLLAYCKSVTMFVRGEKFRADPITVEKVSKNPKFSILKNTQIIEVKGDKFVKSVIYKNSKTGEEKEIPIDGIFMEIGLIPATGFIKDLVKLDEWGHIIVDPRTQRAQLLTPPEIGTDATRGESGARGVDRTTTSATQRLRNEADGVISDGVWAAGDCTDGLYHQNNIAAGDAVRALEDIYLYLHAK